MRGSFQEQFGLGEPPVHARQALREATRPDHDAVDAAFSRYDLTHADGYADFLAAQARVFAPVETALDAAGVEALVPDWPLRRRADRLSDDLARLGRPTVFGDIDLRLTGPAAVLGALYVLEGSRLGGALLSRSAPQGAPTRFLIDDDRAARWRALVDLIDRRLTRPQDIDDAVTAARAVFQIFLAAAQREHGQ
ncbi:biliverdin-producing heme oxygenase [Brevundimonas sp. SORGH_AS_0993]|uniref:biliverdin-producing heme oxygenase n=1 Tax=Brevundimonas sp. SORGH_AS_0993 TaxID=3041794 RepID=UPI002780D294|nr:biliverdin-producing heme oxygenase [Brevundimonas sp. SORGH_AS_0993]MDQ1154479.1 heme oxygenase [Brevundimonas sp. SORGH_AS_0993]